MSKILQVGIIGTGVGLRTHLPAFNAISDGNVLALAGRNLKRSSELADRNGIKHALSFEDVCNHPDIDLVCVTSPNPFHFIHVISALEAGKHVLCEKPLGMNFQDTQKLINASHARPAQLALVNHQLRFNPFLQKVREIISEGQIGRPYFLRMHQQSCGFSDRQAPWNWSFDAKQGGGIRLAMGSHLIDLIISWFGTNIDLVNGTMDPVIPIRPGDDGVPTPITASGFFSATLEFSRGLTAQLSATAAAHTSAGFEFSIFGETGEIHFNLKDKLTGSYSRNRGQFGVIPVDGVSMAELENRVSIFSGSFPYFASKIVDAIVSKNWSHIEPAAHFADALITQRVLDAVAQSSNTGISQRMSKSITRNEFF